MIGSVCKVSAIILCVLALLFSLFSGMTFGGILVTMLSAFLYGLLLYAVGEIAEQLTFSNQNTYELYHLLKRLVPPEEKDTSHPIPPAPNVKRTADGGWICKKCDTINDGNKSFCRDCGTYK